MRPYYERTDLGITLYHADCLDIAPSLPKGEIDLLLTDPPYGVQWRSNRPTQRDMFPVMQGDSDTDGIYAALAAIIPSIRRGRHVYIFGPFNPYSLPLTEPTTLIWDKGIIGTGDLAKPWGPAHECITFATHELSKANREKGYGRMAARIRQGSVISVQRRQSGQVKRHPTEKPVALLRQLVESSSVYGEVVLDPFVGSGSTLVAALAEGRRAIGIEIEERYCAIAAERIERLAPHVTELMSL